MSIPNSSSVSKARRVSVTFQLDGCALASHASMRRSKTRTSQRRVLARASAAAAPAGPAPVRR